MKIPGLVLLETNPRLSSRLGGLSYAGYRLLDYALTADAGIPLDINKVQNDIRIRTYIESVAFS